MRFLVLTASTALTCVLAAPSSYSNAKPFSFPLPAPALPSESQSLVAFLSSDAAEKRAVIPQPDHILTARQLNSISSTTPRNSTTPSLPKSTVQLCTAPNFQGECYTATWPINTCIDLSGYAGQTLSFRPSSNSSCLLMQSRCDASDFYVEISGNDAEELELGRDLSSLQWIGKSKSYICFADLNVLRRWVVRMRGARRVQG